MKNICIHKDNKISFMDIPKHYACVSDGKVIIFDEQWITVNGEDNDGKGQHVLIKENGDIIAGLGGKFKNLKDLGKNKSVTKDDLKTAWKKVINATKKSIYYNGTINKKRFNDAKESLEEFIELKKRASLDVLNNFKIRHDPEKMLEVLLNGNVNSNGNLHSVEINFLKAKNIKEIERELKKVGFKNFQLPENLEGAKAAATGIATILNRYPILQKYNTFWLTVGEIEDDNVCGQCRMTDGKITINQKFFNSTEELEKYGKNDITSNFHPKGLDSRSVTTHESAHAINGILNNSYHKKFGGYSKFEDHIFYNVCGYTDKTPSGKIWKDVGIYAAKNHLELYAEALSEALCSPNPRPVALKVLKETDKEMKELGLLKYKDY